MYILDYNANSDYDIKTDKIVSKKFPVMDSIANRDSLIQH